MGYSTPPLRVGANLVGFHQPRQAYDVVEFAFPPPPSLAVVWPPRRRSTPLGEPPNLCCCFPQIRGRIPHRRTPPGRAPASLAALLVSASVRALDTAVFLFFSPYCAAQQGKGPNSLPPTAQNQPARKAQPATLANQPRWPVG
jgi:hypothetical protein